MNWLVDEVINSLASVCRLASLERLSAAQLARLTKALRLTAGKLEAEAARRMRDGRLPDELTPWARTAQKTRCPS